MNSRMNYILSINTDRNQLLGNTLRDMEQEEETQWIRTSIKYNQETNTNYNDLRRLSKVEIKQHLNRWDKNKWDVEILTKSSLQLYRRFKSDIREEEFYDNRPASKIFNRARTNTLQLNDRNRHQNKDTHCEICGDLNTKEDIYHFILHCHKLKEMRIYIAELQQPYIEDQEQIVGEFLFERKNIDKKKESLYQMWKRRESLLKTNRN